MLDRATRLAPDDPTAALLLASAISVDPPRADDLLERAQARHSSNRSLLAARVASAARRGDIALAAARLHAMLSMGAPLDSPDFAALAARIARDSGAPGWIGLSANGTLHILGRGVTLCVGDKPHRLPRSREGGRFALPEGWQHAGTITATTRAGMLIGSPVAIGSVLRVEGCITGQTHSSVSGWAWHPNDPDQPVRLALVNSEGKHLASVLADQATPALPAGDGFARARGFRIDLGAAGTGTAGPLRLCAPDGSILPGGPILCGAEEAASRMAAASLASSNPADPWRPIPTMTAHGAPHATAAAPAGRWTVILVLDPSHPMLPACLHAIAALRLRLIAVDASQTAAGLREVISAQGGTYINICGGSGPVLLNAGLTHARCSARLGPLLLLTRPCVLPRGLPAQLAAAMRAHPDAGLVQPLCFSAPVPAATRLDSLNRRCNEGQVEMLAVAAGPVVALHPDCLHQTGLLRDDAYGGETAALADFSWRARHLGWRSILACDSFVAIPEPSGSAEVRAAVAERDGRTLERLHPGAIGTGLEQQIAARGAQARRRLAMAHWADGYHARHSVIFVTHAAGGGVERRVAQCAAAVHADGGRAIIIRPGQTSEGEAVWRISDGVDETHPDLWFHAPAEFDSLAGMLRGDRALRVEYHHAASHDPAICGLAPALGIPYDMIVHDFAMICPRVTFVGGAGRYCGEPADVTECDACIEDHGVRIGRPGSVTAWRAAAVALALGARRIVAPSADTARRFGRYAPDVATSVEPWEDDATLTSGVTRRPRRAGGGPVTVCLAGAIGQDKGFDVLLSCARDAARRRLNIAFRVVGHTIDDERLMNTGRVFVTGKYEEHEALALIRAQNADIGFLPSVWPETWCYALSALWRAGLWTLAFALGAPAERITATGAGRTVPLGMPPARLNDFILGLFAGEADAHG